jgi:hypothetical protein
MGLTAMVYWIGPVDLLVTVSVTVTLSVMVCAVEGAVPLMVSWLPVELKPRPAGSPVTVQEKLPLPPEGEIVPE